MIHIFRSSTVLFVVTVISKVPPQEDQSGWSPIIPPMQQSGKTTKSIHISCTPFIFLLSMRTLHKQYALVHLPYFFHLPSFFFIYLVFLFFQCFLSAFPGGLLAKASAWLSEWVSSYDFTSRQGDFLLFPYISNYSASEIPGHEKNCLQYTYNLDRTNFWLHQDVEGMLLFCLASGEYSWNTILQSQNVENEKKLKNSV